MPARNLHFETPNPPPDFPRPLAVCQETRATPAYRYEGRTRNDKSHIIFQYTLEGAGIFEDGRGRHSLPPGTGFLCESRDPATAYYYPPGTVAPWTFFWIAFTGTAAQLMTRNLVARHGGVYRLPADGGIIRRLRALRTGGASVQTIGPAAGAALVAELLCALAETAETRTTDSHAERLVRAVREGAEQPPDRIPSVAGLAAGLKVSREHLTRTFRRVTGFAPHHYLQRRQMLRACEELADPALSVKELAFRLGFDTVGNFARAFRRHTGMTPSRFRRSGSRPFLL